nr:sesquiterpene synthase [Collybia nuda]
MSTQFVLPDILARWPWPRAINPYYAECRLSSQEWGAKFQAFTPKAQYAFDLCDPSLLASLGFPRTSRAGCRVVCDLMYLFGVFDEHSDVMDARSVRRCADVVMDALRNPQVPRPKDEEIIGEITRSFWCNAIKTVGPTAQRRFIEEFSVYTESVVEQAQDRDHFVFRDIKSYMDIRRNNVGAKPAFALLEMDMELPHEIFDHKSLITLRECTVDMLCLANDMYSFNVEQAKGDDHNIITLIMLHEKLNIQQAMEYVAALHQIFADKFLGTYNSLPSFGSPVVDAMVHRYVQGLGNWIRANDSWSFESWRYFKDEGLKIQKERVVKLLPKTKSLGRSNCAHPELPRDI